MRDVRYLGELGSIRTSIGFCRSIQFFKELHHIREVFVNGPFEEVQKSGIVDGFRIDKLLRGINTIGGRKRDSTDLVDAAHTETECTTFDACTIHIVTDHQDELGDSQQQPSSLTRAKVTLSTSLNCLACSNAALA